MIKEALPVTHEAGIGQLHEPGIAAHQCADAGGVGRKERRDAEGETPPEDQLV